MESDRASRQTVKKIRPVIEKIKMEAVQAPLVISLVFFIPAIMSFILELVMGNSRKQKEKAAVDSEKQAMKNKYSFQEALDKPAI